MTTITLGLGLASTTLVALGYAVRVTFEHDRLTEDEQYGIAGRGGRSGPGPVASTALTGLPAVRPDLRSLVPSGRARVRDAALV